MADPVDHPAHYNAHPAGIECIDVVEPFGFNVGNAVKYLWRAGLKEGSDELQDLRKAAWYVEREIARRAGPLTAIPAAEPADRETTSLRAHLAELALFLEDAGRVPHGCRCLSGAHVSDFTRRRFRGVADRFGQHHERECPFWQEGAPR